MRRSEHGTGAAVGEVDPEGSVTGVGKPNLLSFSAGELGRGDVLAGRFQIEAVIGTGGSGRVLRAFDRESRALVALKILRQDLAGEAVWAERFSRELRVGRAISHPNVCRVFDIGDADGHKFLSMELATGGSLRVDVPKPGASGGALPTPSALRSWDERVADARAIVEGVAALHRAGIVHRDLKPENILRMEDGRLVVTDFGLATDPSSGPGTTIMVGTPSYMAPEVVMGAPATTASDVWGLGIVMHEVFFGFRPQWKVLARGYRRYVRPDEACTSIERAVADLCGRCADDGAELRPATAIDVARELEGALRGKRVVARHLRRRILWGATAAAAVVGLLVVKAEFANKARASSSQVVAALSNPVLQPTGTPADWSQGATKLASFDGRLHCYALVDGGKKVRAIWGSPRRAEDVDLKTGARQPANLLSETYQDGCPALSPDGKSLLFEKANETGTHIWLGTASGAESRPLVRGSAPEWIQGDQEFAFEFDSRHAGLFSIPTGQLNVVGDESQKPRQLVQKAVDPSGKHIAIRYFTDTVEHLVVVQSLPSLEVEGTFILPSSRKGLLFSKSGSEILASMDDSDGGTELVSANWKTQVLRRIGRTTQTELVGVLNADDHSVVASRVLRRDLWLDSYPGKADLQRLTVDGKSDAGAVSSSGDFVFQRLLSDGRYVIFLERRGLPARQVTDGPLDVIPSFSPDGRSWLYANYASKAIVECATDSGRCASIHIDPQTPTAPLLDPSGHMLAYVTLMNIPRLHVMNRATGSTTDLGVVAGNCLPFWTSSKRLWTMQAVGTRLVWSELDIDSRKPTGRSRTIVPQGGRECSVPTDIPGIPEHRVVALTDERSEISRRDSQQF